MSNFSVFGLGEDVANLKKGDLVRIKNSGGLHVVAEATDLVSPIEFIVKEVIEAGYGFKYTVDSKMEFAISTIKKGHLDSFYKNNNWSFERIDSRSKQSVSSLGCICTRCRARNEWAAPNRKDGTYVCFECR